MQAFLLKRSSRYIICKASLSSQANLLDGFLTCCRAPLGRFTPSHQRGLSISGNAFGMHMPEPPFTGEQGPGPSFTSHVQDSAFSEAFWRESLQRLDFCLDPDLIIGMLNSNTHAVMNGGESRIAFAAFVALWLCWMTQTRMYDVLTL